MKRFYVDMYIVTKKKTSNLNIFDKNIVSSLYRCVNQRLGHCVLGKMAQKIVRQQQQPFYLSPHMDNVFIENNLY